MPADSGRGQTVDEKISKVLEKLKSLEEFCKGINSNMQVLNKNFDIFTKKLEDYENENKLLRSKMMTLEADNLLVKKELRDLRLVMEDTAYEARANEVELSGIPFVEVEDLTGTVKKICAELSLEVKEQDLSAITRIKGKQGPLNVVRLVFRDKELSRRFVDRGRKSKLIGEKIGFVGRKDYVFFNEYLTPFMRNVLYNCRIFKREQGWKFLWHRGGRIFMRKGESDPVVRIGCLDDLVALKRE